MTRGAQQSHPKDEFQGIPFARVTRPTLVRATTPSRNMPRKKLSNPPTVPRSLRSTNRPETVLPPARKKCKTPTRGRLNGSDSLESHPGVRQRKFLGSFNTRSPKVSHKPKREVEGIRSRAATGPNKMPSRAVVRLTNR